MRKIRVKDGEQINKKGKKVKKISAITLSIALSVAGLIESFQLPYHLLRMQEKRSGEPHRIAELEGEEKREQLAEYFARAIMENDHIDAEYKQTIIDGYTTYVINNYAKYFNEDTISNMYAISSNVNYREMDYKDIYYYIDRQYRMDAISGEAVTPTNTMYISEHSEGVFAHELLHFTSKSLFWQSGFSGIIGCSGVTEGMTEILSEDRTYQPFRDYCRKICAIIGYDKMISYYFSADYNGLKKEMRQYLSDEELNNLLNTMDEYVYQYLYGDENDQSLHDKKEENREIIDSLLSKMKNNAQEKGLQMDIIQLINEYNVMGDYTYEKISEFVSARQENIERYYRNLL